jgi:hypothetical protein
MQICLAVSKGFSQFLNEPIQLHGNTIYLDFELGERAFKRRLAPSTKDFITPPFPRLLLKPWW